jgi:hypothetical protein
VRDVGTDLQTTQAQPPALRIRETVATIQANVQMVQHVMREVMKPEVHYGKVPGTEKPSLWQPGAEVICLAFHWATKYTTEDLSSEDVVRYRVTCALVDRDTGALVGEGQGEASSDEEKYRWRKAICREEFDAFPADRRRTKFARAKGGGHYTIDQVRQEPADIANTVLKIAGKRGHIAAVKTASGCSDMFAQDLEDLPAEVREGMTDEEKKPPKPLGAAAWTKLVKDADEYGYTEADVVASAAIAGHERPGPEMSRDLAVRIFRSMRDNPRVAEACEENPDDAIEFNPTTGEVVDE